MRRTIMRKGTRRCFHILFATEVLVLEPPFSPSSSSSSSSSSSPAVANISHRESVPSGEQDTPSPPSLFSSSSPSSPPREERQKVEDEENNNGRRPPCEASSNSNYSWENEIEQFFPVQPPLISEDTRAEGGGVDRNPRAAASFMDGVASREQDDANSMHQLCALRRHHRHVHRERRDGNSVRDDHPPGSPLSSSGASAARRRSTPPPPPPAVPISVSIMQDRMRKTVRLRSLMPRSFLSVFGKENLEWSDDEAEGKATTSSKAEAHEKESPIKPRCHLLKTHAKELNMLKRMGFKDRRKNKAVTNSRARNHEAPPPPPPSTQHCTKYLGAALDMG